MNKKDEDRRVRRTKKALRKSFAELLTQKNVRHISVQELTDHADINRATFYLHYKDIYELQQQIEDEVVQEINAILEQYMPGREGESPYRLFVALLTYIQDNAALCKTLLGKNSSHTFLNKMCVIVEKHCLYNWLNHFRVNNNTRELNYFSSFIVYGYVAAIAKWVESDMQDSPDKLARMLGNMGQYGVGFLNHQDTAEE